MRRLSALRFIEDRANAAISADAEHGPGYPVWQKIGVDTPRDRQLLMRFDVDGDIWGVRWSDDEGGWSDGDATVFRPNYTHAQWCEVPQANDRNRGD